MKHSLKVVMPMIEISGFNWWKCDSLHCDELFDVLKSHRDKKKLPRINSKQLV